MSGQRGRKSTLRWLDKRCRLSVQYSFWLADPQISKTAKPSEPVAGRGVLEHSLLNLVEREGQFMSSRFGVPGYTHKSLPLSMFWWHLQSAGGAIRVDLGVPSPIHMEECLTVALTTIEANGVEAASTGQVQTVLSNTGIDRRSFTRIPTVWEMPDLVQVQIESFDWFKREGLRELLEEISPISDHHKKMELTFGEYRFDEPWKRLPEHLQEQGKADPRIVEQFCRERDITYASPLRIKADCAS